MPPPVTPAGAIVSARVTLNRYFLAGLALIAAHTVALWLALGPHPSPAWDDAHFLASAWRFWNTVQDAGIAGIVAEFRSPKPWLLEIVYLPLLAAGVQDTRWLLLVPMAASWLLYACVYVAGSRLAPPLLAAATALASVAAFRTASFALATQAEIFLCLGVALGLVAATHRGPPWRAGLVLGLSWTLLMAGKQSSIVYVVGLAALVAGLSPLTPRERIRAIALAAALAAVYVVPVYLLNFDTFVAYAREVGALGGVPFTTFLVQLVRGSIGYFAAAAVVLGLVAAWSTRSEASVRRAALAVAVLGAWLLVFGAVLSHNVFRYILPAVPLIAFLPCVLAGGPAGPGARWFRALGWMAGALSVLSLICAQASVHTRWRVPGLVGGGPSLARGEFCQASVDRWLADAARLSQGGEVSVWLAGDHQYLNYETIRWRLEAQGVRRHDVILLADPVTDYLRRADGRPALLLINALGAGVVNLTPVDRLRVLESLVESDPTWRPVGRCDGSGGAVRADGPH
jgi:hypothetical protein